MNMQFSALLYQRPNLVVVESKYQDLIKRFQTAQNVESQIAVIEEVEKVNSQNSTMSALCYIRHSLNTKDVFYQTEQTWWDEHGPIFNEWHNQYQQAVLNSAFRSVLMSEFGDLWFKDLALEQKTFHPDIIPALQRENKLTTDYEKLIATAQIEFAGSVYNLSQMSPFMQDPRRTVRQQAHEAVSSWFLGHETDFDQLFDQLVKVRTQMAKQLGYQNFVQLGYDRLGRLDYDAVDVARYRQSILEDIVPLIKMLYQRQQQRLGLSDFYYYDVSLKFLSGNAVPLGDADWILDQAQIMYDELSPEISQFFAMMRTQGFLDVHTREGKKAGGYCMMLVEPKIPFVFANFNCTQDDVEVITHEVGHAFQAYQARAVRLVNQIMPTAEACEIHSMSMEFLTWNWMEKFFGEAADKFRFTHLSEALNFLPYGATVDEFQHWVYENPSATPAERKQQYRLIEKKYNPTLDYADNDLLQRGGFWFRQGHIFSYPFYYIDYTLAQVCALQFWLKSRQDFTATWQQYLILCQTGGTKTFLELLQLVNLNNPFKVGVLSEVAIEAQKWLGSVRDTEL